METKILPFSEFKDGCVNFLDEYFKNKHFYNIDEKTYSGYDTIVFFSAFDNDTYHELFEIDMNDSYKEEGYEIYLPDEETKKYGMVADTYSAKFGTLNECFKYLINVLNLK